MDRRDFLKSIGLGGLALTLPKPLKVMAARMADLKGPPIHAGLARFRDLGGILVHDFSISCVDPGLQEPHRHMDLLNNWSLHLAAHENGNFIILMHGAPLNYLVVRDAVGGPRFDPAFFRGNLPSKILAETSLDVWIVPRGEPRYPLPELTVALHGTKCGPGVTPGWGPLVDMMTQVRSVRLERTRAIELGLVSPSDPFEAV